MAKKYTRSRSKAITAETAEKYFKKRVKAVKGGKRLSIDVTKIDVLELQPFKTDSFFDTIGAENHYRVTLKSRKSREFVFSKEAISILASVSGKLQAKPAKRIVNKTNHDIHISGLDDTGVVCFKRKPLDKLDAPNNDWHAQKLQAGKLYPKLNKVSGYKDLTNSNPGLKASIKSIMKAGISKSLSTFSTQIKLEPGEGLTITSPIRSGGKVVYNAVKDSDFNYDYNNAVFLSPRITPGVSKAVKGEEISYSSAEAHLAKIFDKITEVYSLPTSGGWGKDEDGDSMVAVLTPWNPHVDDSIAKLSTSIELVLTPQDISGDSHDTYPESSGKEQANNPGWDVGGSLVWSGKGLSDPDNPVERVWLLLPHTVPDGYKLTDIWYTHNTGAGFGGEGDHDNCVTFVRFNAKEYTGSIWGVEYSSPNMSTPAAEGYFGHQTKHERLSRSESSITKIRDRSNYGYRFEIKMVGNSHTRNWQNKFISLKVRFEKDSW